MLKLRLPKKFWDVYIHRTLCVTSSTVEAAVNRRKTVLKKSKEIVLGAVQHTGFGTEILSHRTLAGTGSAIDTQEEIAVISLKKGAATIIIEYNMQGRAFIGCDQREGVKIIFLDIVWNKVKKHALQPKDAHRLGLGNRFLSVPHDLLNAHDQYDLFRLLNIFRYIRHVLQKIDRTIGCGYSIDTQ